LWCICRSCHHCRKRHYLAHVHGSACLRPVAVAYSVEARIALVVIADAATIECGAQGKSPCAEATSKTIERCSKWLQHMSAWTSSRLSDNACSRSRVALHGPHHHLHAVHQRITLRYRLLILVILFADSEPWRQIYRRRLRCLHGIQLALHGCQHWIKRRLHGIQFALHGLQHRVKRGRLLMQRWGSGCIPSIETPLHRCIPIAGARTTLH